MFKIEYYNDYITVMEIGGTLTTYEDGQNVDETLYKQLVGSLIYLIATRPKILYSIQIIFKYMQTSRVSHWNDTKRMLRYIKRILTLGLSYTKATNFELTRYSNSI